MWYKRHTQGDSLELGPSIELGLLFLPEVRLMTVMYVEGRLGLDPHRGLLLVSLEACSWHSILITAASISGSG